MKRSCQRQTQVFDLPVRRMISLVDRKSVVEGKSGDLCVTGVQTCALPISRLVAQQTVITFLHEALLPAPDTGLRFAGPTHDLIGRSEERRGGKEWRSLCDWSSDVCSSDLASCRAADRHNLPA